MRRSHHPLALILLVSLAILAVASAGLVACATFVRTQVAQRGPTPTIGVRATIDTSIVRVVDGDTVVATVGGRSDRVRLIGVDTPETVSPSKPVQCYGPQASTHLKELLPKGTAVRLVTDVETHDVYGRLLAYVYRQRDRVVRQPRAGSRRLRLAAHHLPQRQPRRPVLRARSTTPASATSACGEPVVARACPCPRPRPPPSGPRLRAGSVPR